MRGIASVGGKAGSFGRKDAWRQAVSRRMEQRVLGYGSGGCLRAAAAERGSSMASSMNRG